MFLATIKCGDVVFSHIQAILFDKNGTLEDSQIYLRALGQKTVRIIDAQIPGIDAPLLMALGIDGDRLDLAGLMAVASRRDTKIAAAAYITETGRGWFESLKIAAQAFEEAEECLSRTTTPLFPGSLEILRSLSSAGLKLGILSAATTQDVEKFVAIHQLEPYITLKMGVDHGLNKPEPELFIQACLALGVEPGKTLMVGDSVGDMQMARHAQAAGCIGITWINDSKSVRGADVVINQLDQIQVIQD